VKAATRPRATRGEERLLVIDPRAHAFAAVSIVNLPEFLGRGDTLVLNDAATLPASLRVDEDLELRLMSRFDDGSWLALTLGAGDSTRPTEARGAPRALAEGARLTFGSELSARVLGVDPKSPRLLRITFEQAESEFWQALYRAARPIQYAYLERPLSLWDVQNAYAGRPWAFEMPSAGKPLDFEALLAIRAGGVSIRHLTHAAGISSTGESELDRRLPIAERYDIPEPTALAVNEARAQGRRVVAVGTSVTRALEAAAEHGPVRAGAAITSLVLGPNSHLRAVNGLLTGMHEPGTSHYSLLEAFAPRQLLDQGFRYAESLGYLQHEFGDSCLVLPGVL